MRSGARAGDDLGMRKVYALAAILVAPSLVFAACSSGESNNPSASSASQGGSAAQGSGASGTGTGGAGAATGQTSSATTGSGGSSSNTGGASTGGAGTGGDVPDATPDVSFTYDAGPGDGAVNADSACAAEVVAAKKQPIDIIWAIDTSGSMTAEIIQVKANINTQFADILGASGLDYQVIMLADRGTGSLQVCVAPPLGGFNCGANPPLFQAVDQTVASNNSLSLILSTYDSANLALNWQQYLRYDAAKVFIEVTDDNSSLSGASFDTQLLAKPPAGMFGTAADRNYVFHSIIGVSAGNPAVKCATAVNIGSQYQVVSNLTGGQMFPVCSADYSPIFSAIANGIVGDLACEFTMPAGGDAGAVDPDNVSMQYTPSGGAPIDIPHVADAAQCVGDGWYYDDNLAPTKLILCPATCTTVKADQGGKIDILLGCLNG